MQYIIRMIIAALVALALFIVIPAFLQIIRFPATSPIMAIITVIIWLGAGAYVIWGRPVPLPWNHQ